MALEDEEDDQQELKRIKTLHASKTSEDPLSIPTIPPEIIVEILSRLPVASLLRCRSVCKSWCSFISDPNFFKSHLRLSISNNHYVHHRLIFTTVLENNVKSCPLYDVLFDNSVNSVELDYPLKHTHTDLRIAGCSNGLLFIVIGKDNLCIWNPSTRRSNLLPYTGIKIQHSSYLFFGFGYDESADDYKVVQMYCALRRRARFDIRVMMYSLKTGKWKKIDGFPHGIPSGYGKFSNGALHWVAYFGSSTTETIVSLNLAKETYSEVLQPDYDKGNYALRLGVLGEWLSVLCHYYADRTDVWVMKVYGVKDSWTKLVSIPFLADPDRYRFLKPSIISNDGKILFSFGSKFVLYDAQKNSFSEIHNVDQCLEAYPFVESLVSPYSPCRPQRLL